MATDGGHIMQKISLKTERLIKEMMKIGHSVNMLIMEKKFDELAKVFNTINLEIFIQRKEWKADEIDIFSDSFKFDDFSLVSEFIQEKIQNALDDKNFATNQDTKFFVLKNTLINLAEEEKFGLICWMLSSMTMELLKNRMKHDLGNLELPDYLYPEIYKIEAYEYLQDRFQKGLDQPSIDSDKDIPF